MGQELSRSLARGLGRLIALVLAVLLVILIERYCSLELPFLGPGAKTVSVDGDTIRAADGTGYRLFGIDAPELQQTCTEANGRSWHCGRAAKARLTRLMKGGNVICEGRARDRFDRIVAICRTETVPDLGEAMVRDGYAIDLGGRAGHPYRDAEDEARSAQRGIWRGPFDRPSDWRQANPRSGN